jgi:lon-related putative ATP-dependent protease
VTGRVDRTGEAPRRGRRRPPRELKPAQLRRRLEPRRLPFRTTEEVEPLVGTIGQPRALGAIEFGLEVETAGYNLFVAGPPGSGRTTTVQDAVARFAALRSPPDDWVYVHSFREADRPNAIRLPAGGARRLARDMDEFVRAARREIPRAFESDEYDKRRRAVLTEVQERRDGLAEELRAFANERGFALEITPVGVATVPLADGRPLTADQFGRLPAAEQERITSATKEIQEQNAVFLRRLHRLEQETAERVRELEREVALFAVGPLFHELREKHAGQEKLLAYLDDVQDDVLEHVNDFRAEEEGGLPFPFAPQRPDNFFRYRVNVLVDNAEASGAPVVVERNPTYYNLLGRVEYRAAFGSMVTDFREIKAGALHRANGGFLVLELLDVLRHAFSWEALKRALRAGEVRIENLGEEFSAVPSATLRPEPVPLAVKVVLVGPPLLYHLLYQLDEDFRELFKVKADFAPEMDWSDENVASYARFVSRWVRAAGLRHFDRAAVGLLIEHSARLRESQRKLSARLIDISDVVSEASFWAGRAGHELVEREDVERAVAEREYRSNLIQERVEELIGDGTITIETAGERPGQVNGIAIIDMGDHVFGKPSRVTARTSIGRGTVASVEREIELSGPIHSKGFLILSGYLAGTYGQEQPLALGASITFEQAYDEIEGDSASSAELYALLSALSGIPLRQAIAVTGSVDQHGAVQAVGGVTRKIEGFFAVCKAKGLTGEQGVIVPAANVQNVMLRDEVVRAVEAGDFHVWAVRTIDEGIELLTGRPAREVHSRVRERLAGYADALRSFAGGAEGEGAAPGPRRGRRGGAGNVENPMPAQRSPR